MDIRVIPTGLEYNQVLTNGDSRNIFEYEKNAFELAEKVDGEVVEVYTCSLVNLVFADVEDDGCFEGYGVLTHDDRGDPVLI